MINYQHPDLTQHPPRSPRARLGGYCHLPRLLDKVRAYAAGKIGGYDYNCALDQTFFAFTGIKHEEFLAAVKTGKSDTEMLAWVNAHTARTPAEILSWTALREQSGPGSAGAHGWVSDTLRQIAPERSDIVTFFDLLDLDDHASFGGKT